jgi:uncharacterized lipoprotein
MLKHLTRSYYLMIGIALLFASSSAFAARELHDANARASHHGTRRRQDSKVKRAPGAGGRREQQNHSSSVSASTVLLGDDAVEPRDSLLQSGQAQAFRLRADATGMAGVALLYISSGSTAKSVSVALYRNGQDHPHSLLSSGSAVAAQAGGWTAIAIKPTEVVRGDHYWLAVMGEGGELRYRDSAHRFCSGETSASNQQTLPLSWKTRAHYTSCPASLYLTVGSKTVSKTEKPEPPPVEESHLPETLPPQDLTQPSISGSAVVGDVLDASPGTWSGNPPSFSYQWEDCSGSEGACTEIAGATSASYEPVAADVGHTLRVVVTASSAGGSTNASSAATEAVVEAPVSAPVSSGPPVLSGDAVEGQTLSASEGQWSGDPTSFTYQWEDCNGSGEACSEISGAASSSYKLTASDVGDTVRVTVTATNAGGSASASSQATETVVVEPLGTPVNQSLPAIGGTAQEAQKLTASAGTWSGSPTSFAYQWQDCNAAGEACSPITGATSSSYRLAAGDVGHKIRVVVTATNAGGSTKASSEATGTVVPAAPVNTALPKVSGSTLEGQTLTATEGSWSGSPTAFAYQWQDCNTSGEACSNISGASASSYRLAAGDVGHRLRVVVTATNSGGSTKASSEASATVLPPSPVDTALPQVSGTALEGQTMTATEGSWSGTPTAFAYQWEDCNLAGGGCSEISGATSSSYKLAAGDVGHRIRVVVTATNAGGSTKASSEATGTVLPLAPVNTQLPKLSGSAQEAKTLTATEGSWSGSPTAFTYQWEDCNTSGEGCSAIAGATSSTYKLVAGDVGHTLRVVVTATNAGGSAKASSEASGKVLPAAPANTALPKVSGSAQEGQTLTASEGSWSGEPTSFAYQWEDCNLAGGGCSEISGATSSSHKLTVGDVGHTLRVVVTATNAGGSTKATSEATGTVVTEKAPESKGLPSVTGTDEEGETLSASEGSWTGGPTSFAYQWEDCNASGEGCSHIGGATSSSYKLGAGDVGHTLRVIVTATNGAGSGEATSEATSTVVAAGSAGPQVYVSQTGAGAQSGEGGCSQAHSLRWFNEEGHWGSGRSVAPGTTVDLCGTFTEPVETKGSGTSGKPVTILFTAGAKIAMSGAGCPGSGCINVYGNSEYVTIDGGTDGQIENTERGYAREKDEGPVTTGIEANGCRHCRFENLDIGPMYVAEKGDVVGNTEIRGIKIRPEGGRTEYITVANNYLHDMGWSVNIEAEETTNHIYVEHNTFYHLTHGFTPGGSFNGGDIGPVVFAYNHFYGDGNWEDGEHDTNHVDGVHCFAGYGDYPHYNDEPGKGLYIYDNYITTEGHNVTAPVFLEGSNNHTVCGDKTSDMWVFNNVLTGTSCCGLLTGDSGEEHVFNNTLIGASSSEEGCEAVNSDTEDGRELADQDYRFKNDVVTTCKTLMDAEKQLLAPNGLGYNLWANAGSANEALVCRDPERHGYYFDEFSEWKSCLEQGEEHSITAGSAKLNLTEEVGLLGKPEGGSEAIGHGENLSSLCSETPEEALCKNIDGEARPATGAWDIGAY